MRARGQGLGTKLLAGALDYARGQLALPWVLLTCVDGNTGSARVIEKNGGVLLDKLDGVIDGRPRVTRRYRIEL
ncbi:GNAT family N-acetyltransferase [Candidatus Allofournierella excrementigallinarum]|uniref:GNAT family N-acetyltransferase n=1 Tax=Candidatus Allofournierella excrementigallinarum TaxID=2838592 RepID=UPI00374F40B1